jgi:hypothetical protein
MGGEGGLAASLEGAVNRGSILSQDVNAAKLFLDCLNSSRAERMTRPLSRVHHHCPAGLAGVAGDYRYQKAIGTFRKLLQPFHEQRRQFDARNPSSRHWNLSVSKDRGAQGGLTGCSDAITSAPQQKRLFRNQGGHGRSFNLNL